MLGQAAFSRAVQALDTRDGSLVCLKASVGQQAALAGLKGAQ